MNYICQKVTERISYLIQCIYLIVKSLGWAGVAVKQAPAKSQAYTFRHCMWISSWSLLLLRERSTANPRRDPLRGRHGGGQRRVSKPAIPLKVVGCGIGIGRAGRGHGPVLVVHGGLLVVFFVIRAPARRRWRRRDGRRSRRWRRRRDGRWRTGFDDGDDNGGGTTGYEVDNYGKGATGNDDYDDDDGNDGDGTERYNNQIEARSLTFMRGMKRRNSNIIDQWDLIHCGVAAVGYTHRNCDNIHPWISTTGDLAFSHQQGFTVLNSQKGFRRSLPEISLFSLSSRTVTQWLLTDCGHDCFWRRRWSFLLSGNVDLVSLVPRGLLFWGRWRFYSLTGKVELFKQCITTRWSWSDSRFKKKWFENYEIILSVSTVLFLNGLLKCHGSKVSTWGWHRVNWHQE